MAQWTNNFYILPYSLAFCSEQASLYVLCQQATEDGSYLPPKIAEGTQFNSFFDMSQNDTSDFIH